MGPMLYALVPWTSRVHSVGLFVSAFAVLMTLYGGAFATMPVYLAELFGTEHASVLFGRLLTAHAAAAVAGPVLVNSMRECQVAKGVPPAEAYSSTMYLMACLLIVGFLCNCAMQPIRHTRVRPMSRVFRSKH